jgi:hypothetical protein
MSKDIYSSIEIAQRDIGDPATTNILNKTFYTNIEEIKSQSFQISLCEIYNANKIIIVNKNKIFKGPGLGYLYKTSFKFIVTDPIKIQYHKCKTLYSLQKRTRTLYEKYAINMKEVKNLYEKLKKFAAK